ncbi:MAG: hypothetical protein AAFY06_03965 [Pseudomonadota bacterium]
MTEAPRMTRIVWIVTLSLCAVAAVFGLRAGWYVANLTETDVITAAVADYIDRETSQGNAPAETDCSARPGSNRVWIVVLCMPQADPETTRTEYHVSRYGQMEVFRGG